MANSYTKASVAIPLTPEQTAWGVRLFDVLRDLGSGEPLPAGLPADLQEAVTAVAGVVGVDLTDADWAAADAHEPPDDMPDLSEVSTSCLTETDHAGLYVMGDGVNIEITSAAIQQILRRFDIDQPVAMEWSNDCDKLRPGSFGGGFIVITKDSEAYANTGTQVCQAIQAFREGRQPEFGDVSRYKALVEKIADMQASMENAPWALDDLVAEANALLGRQPVPEAEADASPAMPSP